MFPAFFVKRQDSQFLSSFEISPFKIDFLMMSLSLSLSLSLSPPLCALGIVLDVLLALNDLLSNKDEYPADHGGATKVFLSGLLNDGTKILSGPLQVLVELSCVHNVDSHILVSKNSQSLHESYENVRDQVFQSSDSSPCGQFIVEELEQFEGNDVEMNRVERLTIYRGQQRTSIANLVSLSSASLDLDKAVVVLVDLDLEELPLASKIVNHAIDISNNKKTEAASKGNDNANNDVAVDIMCANGLVNNDAYYDTFATILLPNTFTYPMRRRMYPHFGKDEDHRYVITKSVFNEHDLFDHIMKEGTCIPEQAGLATVTEHKTQQKGKEDENNEEGVCYNPVPVKSCFGGLVIYRASVYLEPKCSYNNIPLFVKMRYSAKDYDMPCEHVTFHHCLKEVNESLTIAIQPDLQTHRVQEKEVLSGEISDPDRLVEESEILALERRLEMSMSMPEMSMSMSMPTSKKGKKKKSEKKKGEKKKGEKKKAEKKKAEKKKKEKRTRTLRQQPVPLEI